MDRIKVFISYSHDSLEHKEWVLKLATYLNNHGVELIFDQWDLRLGSDLHFFMSQGLSQSRLVLCICSENYVYKANTGIGGTGYESMIMMSDLLIDANQNYIIPIVRNNTANTKTPYSLATKLYIDFNDDSNFEENYKKLLYRIYNEDEKARPVLGKNPFISSLANEIDLGNKIRKINYLSINDEDNISFDFSNNDGEYVVGQGEYLFITHWSRAGNNSIYLLDYPGYLYGACAFPEIENILDFDFTSRVRHVKTNEVVILKNSYGNFMAIKIGKVNSSSHGLNKDEINFEYKILKENLF